MNTLTYKISDYGTPGDTTNHSQTFESMDKAKSAAYQFLIGDFGFQIWDIQLNGIKITESNFKGS